MAVPLSEFHPYVLLYAVGCPIPLANRALIETCVDFATQSLVLEEVDQQDVLPGEIDYVLGVPPSSQIVKVRSVMFNGRPLSATTHEMVRYAPALIAGSSGEANVVSGTPVVFYQRELWRPTVTIYPASNTFVAGGLVTAFWYAPTVSAESVPDVLFTNFRAAIVDGALERILRVAGQPFSNPTEADRRGVLYAAGVRNAGALARSGQVVAASRVTPRMFAV